MQVPIVTIEGNIGGGKTTLLQMFEQFLSSEDKVTIKVEHEPVKDFKHFYRNDLIYPLEHFYKNPTDRAFIFQHYVLYVYQQWMKTIETVQLPSKVIVLDNGLNACQIFLTVNKDQYIKCGFLYLTEKYLQLNLNSFQANFMPVFI